MEKIVWHLAMLKAVLLLYPSPPPPEPAGAPLRPSASTLASKLPRTPQEPASDLGPGKALVVAEAALDWRPDRAAHVCLPDSLLALPQGALRGPGCPDDGAGRETCAGGLSGAPVCSAEGGCSKATQDNFANQLPRRRQISGPTASGDVHRGGAVTKLSGRSPRLPSSSEPLSFAAFLPPPPTSLHCPIPCLALSPGLCPLCKYIPQNHFAN